MIGHPRSPGLLLNGNSIVVLQNNKKAIEVNEEGLLGVRTYFF